MYMKQLLICTHNQGKFIEISDLLKDLPVELISLDQAKIKLDVEETGQTYEENALLKAKTYGEMSDLISIADDTGLEIEALNGAPGVHSKRYFNADGEERNRLLLKQIGNNPNKHAEFVASVAVFNPKTSEVKTFQGEVQGEIIENPQGRAHKQLGYDSIFKISSLGKTFAQASLNEKNSVSHRALAVKKAHEYLKEIL